MRQWVYQLWKPVCKEHRLLVLDEHRAQMTEEFKQKLQELSTAYVFVPGGCTSLVQPVNVVFNAPFQTALEKIAQKHMLENLDLYVHGKFTASERRVLLSKWVGEAWEEVCAKPEMITRSFRKCGISIAVDGSEDEVININGVDDYTVRSIESSDDDDIHSDPCKESDAVDDADDNINSDPCEESDAVDNDDDDINSDPCEESSSEYTSSDAEVESSHQVHNA